MKLITACILAGISLGYFMNRVDSHAREVRLSLEHS